MITMMASMSTKLARTYEASLGGFMQGPKGDSGPFKSLPFPSWALARLPLCKQTSCPCIT